MVKLCNIKLDLTYMLPNFIIDDIIEKSTNILLQHFFKEIPYTFLDKCYLHEKNVYYDIVYKDKKFAEYIEELYNNQLILFVPFGTGVMVDGILSNYKFEGINCIGLERIKNEICER